MSVTSYYLACGHAQYEPSNCYQAALLVTNLSDQHCKTTRSYTSLVDSTCDACTFLRGLETLRFHNDNEPLIWMNHVYRASVAGEPEPRDQAIDDSLQLAIAADKRHKNYLQRTSKTGKYVSIDERKHNKNKMVACPVPSGIFYQDKKPCVGRGTECRRAVRGQFESKFINGVWRLQGVIEGEAKDECRKV